MTNLRISLCQTDCIWQDAPSNRRQLENKLARLDPAETDLVLLPEMFTTGFSMESEKLAESMDGPSIRWLIELSNQLNLAVTGSLIIKEHGGYYNRLCWVEPGLKSPKIYDKKHLFSLANEHKHFKPGNQKLILEYKGWKIALFICYDLRFPVWSRNVEGVDLMIYVANWPEKRNLAWKSLLPARAIENQCYVAGVNRIGMDANQIQYCGDSAVYNYEGIQILKLEAQDTVQTIELNKQALEVYKRAYPFLKDADRFQFE